MVTPTKSYFSGSIGNQNSHSRSRQNKSISRLATFSGTKSNKSNKKRSQSRNKRNAGPLSSLNSRSRILRSNSSLSNNVSEQLNKSKMAEREKRRVKKYKAKIDTSATKLTQITSNATELKLAGG